MVSKYSLAVSKVICIDLLNTSIEDLHNYNSVDKFDKSVFPLMENVLFKNKDLQFTEDLRFIF